MVNNQQTIPLQRTSTPRFALLLVGYHKNNLKQRQQRPSEPHHSLFFSPTYIMALLALAIGNFKSHILPWFTQVVSLLVHLEHHV